MKLSIALILVLVAQSASAAQGCPAVLDLQPPQLSTTERRLAQGYANCLTRSKLTSSQARMASLAACQANLPVRRSPALLRAMRQIEQTAIRIGGCKTRITIKAAA